MSENDTKVLHFSLGYLKFIYRCSLFLVLWCFFFFFYYEILFYLLLNCLFPYDRRQ